MPRPTIRALLTLASAGGLAVALIAPAAVQAAPAQKSSDHVVELFCDSLTGSGGTLFLSLAMDDRDGLFAGLAAFPPGAEPFTDPPSLTDDGQQDASGSVTNAAASVDIPVVDANGGSAGTAHVDATLALDGAAEPIHDTFRNGNQKSRVEGTFQALAVSGGSATLPDGSSFALDGDHCSGDEQATTSWGNSPTSSVNVFESTQLSCDLEANGETVGNLFIGIDDGGATAFVDAFFPDFNMDGNTDLPFDGQHISTALDYRTLDTGDPVGSGSIDVTFAATGQPFTFTLRNATGKRTTSGEIFPASGTLVAPGFAPFDLGGCQLVQQSSRQIAGPIHAPKPTGKAPANDAPGGATVIHAGSKLNEDTKSAAVDAEVPFDCLTAFGLAGIKTVWFRIAGTGGDVTVDTAGSSFDTVISVYTASGGGYEPVDGACVDDPPIQPIGRTLQSAVTFTAAAGTTFFVQVGGVDDDLNWGTLKLSVR